MMLLIGSLLAVAICLYTSQKESEFDSNQSIPQTLVPSPLGNQATFDVLEVLTFGRGGGFTGASKDFSLNSNGELSQVFLAKSSKRVDSLSAEIAESYFAKFDSLFKVQGEIRHPGNMTYYITRRTKDTTQNLVWGASNFAPDSTVIQLYDELISQVEK